MEALKIRRLPVINKSKRMIGILSLGDVSHSASGDLLSECVKSVSAHHHWNTRDATRPAEDLCPPGALWLWANILRKLGAIRLLRMVPSE
jgi:hypothetical protein